MRQVWIAFSVSLLAFACQPPSHPMEEGQTDGGPDPGCMPRGETETLCGDEHDDDCDGRIDCSDPDCSGIGYCASCGAAEHLEGEPLALPDDGTGLHPYLATIAITGFDGDQTLEDVAGFLGVCVTMEHSWLRDLQIELLDPAGTTVVLQQFMGRMPDIEVFMGEPNDSDGLDPVPGTGMEYCWTPNASNPPMLDYANTTGVHTLPPGDYQAVDGFDGLVGAPLDGDWTIKVVDLWEDDNGFIFSWSINFDPSLVPDCAEPID